MSQNAITLTSGMRKNLFSLQSTNTLLERTQKRMATGLRVQTAVDDPVNYFTALGHRQRAEDLGSRKDEMAESIQTVMAANEGVTAITSLIASAKSLAQSALSASSEEEVNTLKDQYNEVLNQIDLLVNDSGYKGVNLLASDTHTVNFNEEGDSNLVMTGFDATYEGLGITQAADGSPIPLTQASGEITGGGDPNTWTISISADAGGTYDGTGGNVDVTFTEGGAGVTSASASYGSGTITVTTAAGGSTAAAIAEAISTIDGFSASASATGTGGTTTINTGSGSLSGGTELANTSWWDSGNDGADKELVRASISQLDAARTTLRSESQKLSTNLSTITIRQDFTKGMINTLEDGAAELTNADMNEEGANMLMLQTRQSLGTTSLSLASQAAQSVLRLF